MDTEDIGAHPKVTQEAVALLAALAGLSADLKPLSALAAAHFGSMSARRALDLGDAEPMTNFDPRWG
jgi:hypothetical protein